MREVFFEDLDILILFNPALDGNGSPTRLTEPSDGGADLAYSTIRVYARRGSRPVRTPVGSDRCRPRLSSSRYPCPISRVP